jgi:hypothetical protein
MRSQKRRQRMRPSRCPEQLILRQTLVLQQEKPLPRQAQRTQQSLWSPKLWRWRQTQTRQQMPRSASQRQMTSVMSCSRA